MTQANFENQQYVLVPEHLLADHFRLLNEILDACGPLWPQKERVELGHGVAAMLTTARQFHGAVLNTMIGVFEDKLGETNE